MIGLFSLRPSAVRASVDLEAFLAIEVELEGEVATDDGLEVVVAEGVGGRITGSV